MLRAPCFLCRGMGSWTGLELGRGFSPSPPCDNHTRRAFKAPRRLGRHSSSKIFLVSHRESPTPPSSPTRDLRHARRRLLSRKKQESESDCSYRAAQRSREQMPDATLDKKRPLLEGTMHSMPLSNQTKTGRVRDADEPHIPRESRCPGKNDVQSKHASLGL